MKMGQPRSRKVMSLSFMVSHGPSSGLSFSFYSFHLLQDTDAVNIGTCLIANSALIVM